MGGATGNGGSGFGGSRLRLGRTVLVLLAVIAAFAVGSAPAKAAGQDDTLVSFFQADAGSGFEMYVVAVRQPGKRTEVEVTLSGEYQTAIYRKRRGVRLTRDELNFRLASLGSVDMELESRRRFRVRRCEIKVSSTRFTGRLHFRGEGSYSTAHAGKARGFLQVQSGDSECRTLSHKNSGENTSATLTSCGPGPQLGFYGTESGWFGDGFFSAFSQERSDGLDIIRTAFADGRDGDFGYDEGLRHAKVRPAWPFAGTGAYEEGELTGDLSVALPGAPDTPLVPSGRAKLRESDRARGRQCGVDFEGLLLGFGLYPYGAYAAPASAPEDAAAVGFDRRQ